MTYRLELAGRAERYFNRLDASMKARVSLRFKEILADPFNQDVGKPLVGKQGLRSSRVGSLRILYRVYDEQILVLVERIAPRGQVYRDL